MRLFPLNPRMGGDLYRHRQKLIENEISPELMPMVPWMVRLLEMGFYKSKEEKRSGAVIVEDVD
jgi:hypothetical protein